MKTHTFMDFSKFEDVSANQHCHPALSTCLNVCWMKFQDAFI